MAAIAKKAKLENISSSSESTNELVEFKDWLKSENIIVDSKVSIVEGKCCARYGMIAVEDIPADYVLFTIPNDSLLSPENCAISKLLDKEAKVLQSDSRWVPLLVALLHEYLNKKSRWRPYLELFPDLSELDHPMYWKPDEMVNELKGTGIIESVHRDLKNIKNEFTEIVLPFVRAHESEFCKEAIDEKLYKKLVGFVMAYSFTGPYNEETEVFPPPVMVPLADVLNHISKNNAKLNFNKENLTMVSTKSIEKGEEIFNTYGELSNSQLLHMYGFAERYPENVSDAVEIPMEWLLDVFKENKSQEDCKIADDRWEYLKKVNLITSDGVFAVGPEGILTEEELHYSLRVLFMSTKDFEELDGWDEDDEEDDMSIENLPNLSKDWKHLLVRLGTLRIKQFDSTIEGEEELLNKEDSLTSRQKWAVYVRYSQRKIVQNMIDVCKPRNLK